MKDKCILVTGGFDPLHSGHIEYFKGAKKICDYLIVGVNSDDWLIRKKGLNFYSYEERINIISELSIVDKVISFNDDDNSASDAISKCLEISKKVIFANGGDRKKTDIPELRIFLDNSNVEFIFNVGGSDKLNSSSEILNNFKSNLINNKNFQDKKFESVSKPWGAYKTLSRGNGFKIKILEIFPKEKISLQYHNERSEFWIILEGIADVQLEEKVIRLNKDEQIFIPKGSKHRVENCGDNQLKIIEISLGEYIEEDDIIRLEDEYGRE